MQKKFKQTEWKALKIVSEPTTTAPQIRRDENGRLWAWTHGGKYVVATAQPKPKPTAAEKAVAVALASVPACIVAAPSDQGLDDNSPKEWFYVVRHEIDLFEEGETSDIKNRRQLAQAKSSLDKLRPFYLA